MFLQDDFKTMDRVYLQDDECEGIAPRKQSTAPHPVKPCFVLLFNRTPLARFNILSELVVARLLGR